MHWNALPSSQKRPSGKAIRQSVTLEIIEARRDKQFQQTTHTFERLSLYLAPPWRTPPTVLIPFPKWKP